MDGTSRNMSCVGAGSKPCAVYIFVQQKLRPLAEKGAHEAQLIMVGVEQAAMVALDMPEHQLYPALVTQREYQRK